MLSEPGLPRRTLIIMSHGFKGTSVGPARRFVDFARVLVNHGFAVLRFDQSHNGCVIGAGAARACDPGIHRAERPAVEHREREERLAGACVES